MTFSVAARCARTGRFGVVVASSSPAVAARCAWARAGVGAACSQNVTDPGLGPALLDRLAAGDGAAAALDAVVAGAAGIAWRQLSVVGRRGPPAAYSGAATLGRHATAFGPDAVAAGNLLADGGVVDAAVDAFSATPAAPLAVRLVAALRAGRDAGGEAGPLHSAGLVVVDDVAWPVVDLRVDWSDADPVEDLAGLWERWAPLEDDYRRRATDPAAAPGYGVPGEAGPQPG